MLLIPYENKGQSHQQFQGQGVDKQYQDCNKIEPFVKCTTQQCCQLLIIESTRKYDYGDSIVTLCLRIHVSLQLGETTIQLSHSLEPTTGFECSCKSFVLFLGFFPLAWLSNNCCCVTVQGMILHSAPSIFVSCTRRQNYPSSCSCVLSSQLYIWLLYQQPCRIPIFIDTFQRYYISAKAI